MGGSVDPNTKYSSFAGFIFVFNLIIGAGALNLPLGMTIYFLISSTKGFNTAGLVLGTIMLCILCFLRLS